MHLSLIDAVTARNPYAGFENQKGSAYPKDMMEYNVMLVIKHF